MLSIFHQRAFDLVEEFWPEYEPDFELINDVAGVLAWIETL